MNAFKAGKAIAVTSARSVLAPVFDCKSWHQGKSTIIRFKRQMAAERVGSDKQI